MKTNKFSYKGFNSEYEEICSFKENGVSFTLYKEQRIKNVPKELVDYESEEFRTYSYKAFFQKMHHITDNPDLGTCDAIVVRCYGRYKCETYICNVIYRNSSDDTKKRYADLYCETTGNPKYRLATGGLV